MVLVEYEDIFYEETDRTPKEYAVIFNSRLKAQSVNKNNYLAEWEYVGRKIYNDDEYENYYKEYEYEEEEEGQDVEFEEYITLKFGNSPPPIVYLNGQSPRGCICSHPIKHLYFIYNIRRKIIFQIGSGCAKKFLPYYRKTCEVCSALHKRKSSLVCCSCDKFVNEKIKFGKYKGTTFYDIFKKDKQYIKWLMSIKKDLKDKNLLKFLNAVEITLVRYGVIEKKVDEDS